MNRKTILVLYYTRGVYPLRNTIQTYLYCWRHYSRHDVVHVNIGLGFPETLISRLDIDVVIFNTIFLGMRWSPEIFRKFTARCTYLKELECIKIAMPQDEFLNTDLLNVFINDFHVTHLLTCAYEPDWPTIYDRIDRNKVKITTVLTGYLDPDTIRRIEQKKRQPRERDIDLGYRAWKAEYWLGAHGQHKVRIAEVCEKAGAQLGLKTDISMRVEDVLAGDSWFDFLLRCKATIGVEGGASVLDRTGEIRRKVDSYLKLHPTATFEEVKSACFAEEDHRIELACISPRHLEACATETLQFLVEGAYNGILQPWRHYVPIKKDYSNIDNVLTVLANTAEMKKITDAAYRDVIGSGKWTYINFVRDIERTIIDSASVLQRKHGAIAQRVIRRLINLRDEAGWLFIRFLSNQKRRRLAKYAYRIAVRLFPVD
jgi:hypothetical protein